MEKAKILICKELYCHGKTKISLHNKIHICSLPLQVVFSMKISKVLFTFESNGGLLKHFSTFTIPHIILML